MEEGYNWLNQTLLERVLNQELKYMVDESISVAVLGKSLLFDDVFETDLDPSGALMHAAHQLLVELILFTGGTEISHY